MSTESKSKKRLMQKDIRLLSSKIKHEPEHDELQSNSKKARKSSEISEFSTSYPDELKASKLKSEVRKRVAKTAEQDSSPKLELSQLVKRTDFLEQPKKYCVWQDTKRENLNLKSTQLYTEKEAQLILAKCEQELQYNVGDLAKIHIFGKWIDIPRKQVAHGDPGLTYSFSGNTVPARPWTPFLNKIRNQITDATGYTFNFVLINRYKDGHDYMGEHKDDEKDLCKGYPIASLSLGQCRDFVFRHQDSRGKNAKKKIDPVTLPLKNGMLLMMNDPTNSYWYHSLPRRTRALGVRVNMTFRKMEPSQCKAIKKE